MAAPVRETRSGLTAKRGAKSAVHRAHAEVLKNATRFQENADIFNPLWVVETAAALDRHPYYLMKPVYDAVEAVARRNGSGNGRKRGEGRFELAYLAFVFSRDSDVRPWWQHAGHSIWTSSGFEERPSYPLVQRRFAELEDPAVINAYELVAARFIQRAVKGSGGRVGRFLHVDSTEAETHARLEHDCPAGSACWKRREEWRYRVSAKASSSDVREERHRQAVQPEPEEMAPELFDAKTAFTEVGEAEAVVRDDDVLRVQVGGCWWKVLDSTAGVRAYWDRTRNRLRRFWVGFYNGKAIDHFTGSPVAVRITAASINEFVTYPELFEAAVANTGHRPLAVVADRGYSISYVFEQNTRNGVASVMPWRARGKITDRAREDLQEHDRHGIVRCKHCGGPTRFVSFARSAGRPKAKDEEKSEARLRGPRLEVQCLVPVEAGCWKRQTIACEKSWRMLLPLWRDTPLYLALRRSHDRYERVHHHWRVRWRVGADHHGQRPKRKGIYNQQLRANVALLIEWMMICWREGWMPDQRPPRPLDLERVVREDGSEHVRSLRTYRRKLGLDKPYGVVAKALDLGELLPQAAPDAEDLEDPTEPPDRLSEIEAEEDAREAEIELVQEEADAAEVDLPSIDEDLAR